MKKSVIIQSIIIAAVTVLVATLTAFAWFSQGNRPDAGQVGASVTDALQLDYAFYRSTDGTNYTEATAQQSFVDEHILPGETAYCRIVITNRSDAVTLRIRFTSVTYAFTGLTGEEEAAAAALMSENMFLTSASGDQGLPKAITAGTITLGSYALAAGATITVDYRFWVRSEFAGAGAPFEIACGGIVFGK